MQDNELDRIASRISDRLGNGESRLDRRLTKIEVDVAIIKDHMSYPCAKHESIILDIKEIKTKQSFLYPVLTAVVSGTIVGIVITLARYFIK